MNNIKEIREGLNISQTELARKVGVSQPYIYDLENGNRGAKQETLLLIAAVLGVTVEELMEEKAG